MVQQGIPTAVNADLHLSTPGLTESFAAGVTLAWTITLTLVSSPAALADAYVCMEPDGGKRIQDRPCQGETKRRYQEESLREFNRLGDRPPLDESTALGRCVNRLERLTDFDYPRSRVVDLCLNNTIIGGLLDGTRLPSPDGGMIIGGPLNGSHLPGADGGMIIGGPLDGTNLPGSTGGMVVGGPFSGSDLPGYEGGTIVGGPLSGTTLPASSGGMIIGGPFSGTSWPGHNGGIIAGGPMSGTYIPRHWDIALILMMYLTQDPGLIDE